MQPPQQQHTSDSVECGVLRRGFCVHQEATNRVLTLFPCSLRHPNVVFVYGVVVPPLEHSNSDDEHGEEGEGQEAREPPRPAATPHGPGMVRCSSACIC